MRQASYLIDTDWVIHYLNGHGEIVKKVKSLANNGLAISVVSLAELYEGIYYSTNPEENERSLKEFLTSVSVLGVEDEVGKLFGKQRGKLRQARKMIGDFDLLIASTCLWHSLMLLTNNRKHFEAVEGLTISSAL